MIVRNMESFDVPYVTELEMELFTDAWNARSIEETRCQKNTACFIAEEREIRCGYLMVYYVCDTCEIVRIGVSSAHRRKGVATLLLRQLETFCESHRIRKMLLDVRESNIGARRFYQSCGFREDGVRKAFYQKPQEDAVLMSIEWTASF